MLAQHATVCPLEGLDARERVLVQPRVACYDPEFDLVIIAVPDLLYTRDGGWIWRETKTSSSRLYEGKPLLWSFPQLALALVMIAAGALKGELSRSRVEFELLHADDLSFEELDPSRPQVVSDAREVLASLARPWAEDSLFQPALGPPPGKCWQASPGPGPRTHFSRRPLAGTAAAAKPCSGASRAVTTCTPAPSRPRITDARCSLRPRRLVRLR